jgi:hypothetical protein
MTHSILLTNKEQFLERFESPGVTYILGNTYSLLWYSNVYKLITRAYPGASQWYREYDSSQLLISKTSSNQLAMFSKHAIMFVGDIEQYEKPVGKKIIEYSVSYQGPWHICIFVSHEYVKKNKLVINGYEAPAWVSRFDYEKIATWIGNGVLVNPEFTNELFTRYQTIPLDTACLMVQYQAVIGRHSELFWRFYSDTLVIEDEKSPLYNLSTIFLMGDAYAFSKAWHAYKNRYEPEFWISFWEQQVWQALMYYKYAAAGSMDEAKRWGVRLPFAVLNNGWRKIKYPKLVQAYHDIAQFDGAYKSGRVVSLLGLELLLARYVTIS